ncbi:hypothetical protein BN3456_01583 [Clostridium sp. C105KSO13]|nr:hypothetical protein BN3456_01583 [Clostridium sp. C105KSO13]
MKSHVINPSKFSKDIYTQEVLLKAAYAFTDCSYIHLDTDAEDYIVSLTPKEGTDANHLYEKFENELIAQETRRLVAEKTKNIRELTVARALASTIVNVSADAVESTDMIQIVF